MDPKQKLTAIQQQKSKLKARIDEINTSEIDRQTQDPQLDRLIQKKQALELERAKQEEYKKLENEYIARRKQMERQRELQRVKNEKRVIELQVAMKKVVLDGIKQKVRGMNSDQLMRPNFLSRLNQSNQGQVSKQNFKEAFEGYLLDEGPEKIVVKYDLKRLNEERLNIFQKKEEVIMRQILLKQLTASPVPIEMDVLSLTREQLRQQLEERGIDYEQFMHPVMKEEIVENYSHIQKSIKDRIGDKKKELDIQKEEALLNQRKRKILRQQVSAMPYKDVQLVKRLLYDLFDEIVKDYEQRHVALTSQDQQQRVNNLQKQYNQICSNNLVEELSFDIVERMLEEMRDQLIKESAQEVSKLHYFAHQKTQECFRAVFGQGSIYPKIQQLDKFKVPLLFVSEDVNEVGRPKEEKYIKNLQNEYNVYQTQTSTTNLINDIALLDLEEQYLSKISTQLKKQTEFKTEDCLFYYDRLLFAVSRQDIKSVSDNQTYYSIKNPLEQLMNVHKIHKNWLIQTDTQILLVTPWGQEYLGQQLGARISNPCGNITSSQLYPVTTLLGHPCSVLLGFQKGQLLKFNFNRNRINQRQTNITHYMPLIEHAKSGDDAAFPLDNRNYLAIEQEKPKPTDELHEYRQFFEHHTEPIIFIGFYRIDKMISVDKSLRCAIWDYNKNRGAANFQPVFKFQIKSSYSIYNEDENPRYKDIYPTPSSKETPEVMYQKYMLTEAYLRLQLYNNPKKQIAYFKAPQWDQEEENKAIWKVTYKESKGQVNKIMESYYNVVDGKITAEQAQLQGDTIYILCQREHVIRNDLKTLKLYSWIIPEKRLGKVGVQIDMFKDQKVSNFLLLPNLFRGTDLQLVLVANSGRLLLFSLVTGQLLKNINQQISSPEKNSDIYFKNLVKGQNGLVYGISSWGVLELGWQDNNSINDRTKLNKAIDTTKRKYFR